MAYTDPKDSKKQGLAKVAEVTLRRFKNVVHLLTLLPLLFMGGLVIGLAAAPTIGLFQWALDQTQSWAFYFRLPALGATLGVGFYVWGLSLVALVPTVNNLFRLKLKPWRGSYFSLETIPWYMHNGLLYIVRYTFLEFITPTPINTWFYQRMGMKIGKGVQINTTAISDPGLIQMEDRVTIGGSATIIGHYAVGGYLILSPVKICEGATVGLRAIIMGGVEIGAGARILPNSVILPRSKIPAGETWGGVPARMIPPDPNKGENADKKVA